MSESRANDVDEAVALIRKAMKKVRTLNRTPHEGLSTKGSVAMRDSASNAR